MKFKKFTQAYFLIQNNQAYERSLSKRGQAATLGIFLGGLFMWRFWPEKVYGTERINWSGMIMKQISIY